MSRVTTSSLYIACLLAGLSTITHAGGMTLSGSKASAAKSPISSNRPWGNGVHKTAPVYQALPPPNTYYPGAAPNNGWYTPMLPPGVAPGWYSPSLPAGNAVITAAPTVEVEVQGSDFYEQQNIIYTARVVSDGNIKTLKPELPSTRGAALEYLDGPLVSTRINPRTDKQQIINTYRYKLMPLHSGKIVIPAIHFEGTHAAVLPVRQGPGAPAATPASDFDIAATGDLRLRVQSADPAVTPWLPLHDLRLHTNLLQKAPVKAGEPVTLVVELNAIGAQGNQLPSLANQLESTQYRIYRDSTNIKNALSADGKYVAGSRTETYTIIPLEAGWIRLPEVTLAWWDVDTHSPMLAGLPLGLSDRARAAAIAVAEQPLFPFYFWVPMIVALCLLAGFWLGAWQRSRRLFTAVGTWLSATGQGARQSVNRITRRLAPQQLVNRLRRGLAVLMPRSIKLWMCTRCLRDEQDPDAWYTEFKSRMCENLDIPLHTPLAHIAEQIIITNTPAEPARLRNLMHSLDGAIYGGGPLDFPVWKAAIVQQLRPRLFPRRAARARHTKAELPALNPRIV